MYFCQGAEKLRPELSLSDRCDRLRATKVRYQAVQQDPLQFRRFYPGMDWLEASA